MSCYLITGGAGFVGSHVADALVARGDEVVLLDNLSTGRFENVRHLVEAGDVELVEGSASDPALVEELMSQVEACFHLSSAVGVGLITERPLDSTIHSVRSNDVVISAAARHGVRLLFSSTSEVYGKNGAGPLREDSDRVLGPVEVPRWTYATAKSFGEILALGYAREEGAGMVVARLFNTVGPRQTGAYGMVLPRFVRQALAGEDLTVYGDGSQTRCFTHVYDTVEALLLLIDSDAAVGNAYNVGCDEEITIMSLARRVLEQTGSSSEIALVPYEEAYAGAFEELARRRPDCSALVELTGWKPSLNVRHAIRDLVAYERDRVSEPLASDVGA